MPEIKRMPKMRVAYLTRTGPFDQAIPSGMDALTAWMRENNVRPMGPPLSMFPDDPAEVAAGNLGSEIGIPVGPDVEPSGEIQIREIGDADVATMVYRTRDEIDQAYAQVYAWMQQQGYRDAGAPMETYLGSADQFVAEIAIPIALAEAMAEEMVAEAIEEEMEAEAAAPSQSGGARKRTSAKKASTRKAAGKKSATRARASSRKATSKKAAKKSAPARKTRATKKTARKRSAKRG